MLAVIYGYNSIFLSIFLSIRMDEVSQEERLQAIAVSYFYTHTQHTIFPLSHTYTYVHKLNANPNLTLTGQNVLTMQKGPNYNGFTKSNISTHSAQQDTLMAVETTNHSCLSESDHPF